MDIIFTMKEVEHKHVGKRMFAISQSGVKLCGKIEFFKPNMFICAHLADPNDPFKTTGTVVKYVLEESNITDDKILNNGGK